MEKNSHPEHGYVLAMLSCRREAEATTEILNVGIHVYHYITPIQFDLV